MRDAVQRIWDWELPMRDAVQRIWDWELPIVDWVLPKPTGSELRLC
jgi:hypothetical protein